MIVREETIEINPTATELAQAFCDFDAPDQAYFFSQIAKITDAWTGPFVMQLQWVCDSQHLTYGGRTVMQQIGEYSHQTEGVQPALPQDDMPDLSRVHRAKKLYDSEYVGQDAQKLWAWAWGKTDEHC